jgi:hypothetical protein
VPWLSQRSSFGTQSLRCEAVHTIGLFSISRLGAAFRRGGRAGKRHRCVQVCGSTGLQGVNCFVPTPARHTIPSQWLTRSKSEQEASPTLSGHRNATRAWRLGLTHVAVFVILSGCADLTSISRRTLSQERITNPKGRLFIWMPSNVWCSPKRLVSSVRSRVQTPFRPSQLRLAEASRLLHKAPFPWRRLSMKHRPA